MLEDGLHLLTYTTQTLVVVVIVHYINGLK